MYRTRHRNMLLYLFNVILDASCKFSTRRNDIYDPSVRINKNLSKLYNSLDASSQLGDALTKFCYSSNYTLKYSSIFRRSVISTWRRVHSTQRSIKMQLWPQWLTILVGVSYVGGYSLALHLS